MNVHEEIEHELDLFMETLDEWIELCLDCKHAYRRKSDADMLFCRLRKRKCPYKKQKQIERKDE